MHRRQFTLTVPLIAATALTIRNVAAQAPSSSTFPAVESQAAARMRREAAAFLASLSPDQRRSASFPLGAEQRTIWSNLPVGMVPRVGASLDELADGSRQRAHALLRASSSSQGYLKMAAVMRHDQLLHDMQAAALAGDATRGSRSAIVDSMGAGKFWLAVFGDPIGDENWGWLITGHHLGATFTVAGSRVAYVPLFLGAAPVLIETGLYAGQTALSHESNRGYELLRSLSAKQRADAVLSTGSFGDIVTGVGRQRSLARYEGVSAAGLDSAQQGLLWALVEEYVRNADFEPATAQLDAIKAAGLEMLHFSWRGPTDDPNGQFYYRVHGPRIIIEYADQGGNHVHTITRDPVNDYGTDWLGLHYEEHAHG